MTTPRPAGRHLALVGPTASGKSAVGLALAERRNAAGRPVEIVSCDSMQVYRGMDVGTAKPTAAEQARVRHHLIDVVDPTEDFNMPRFVAAVAEALDDIEARGASAVLVGGTGLYLRGVVDQLEPPPHFPEIAEQLEADPDTAALTEQLRELDPEALAHIPPGNRRRIIRALEVTLGTGTPFSTHGPGLHNYGPTPFVLTGLWPSREVLTTRIAARYDAQMAEGLLGEAQRLADLGPSLSRTAAQALGYRELLGHLRGRGTLEEALRDARVRTRRFAVRQQRWFGRDPRITWFDPPGVAATGGPSGGSGPCGATAPVVGTGPPMATIESVADRLEELWAKRAAAGVGSVATVGGAAVRPGTA